MVSHDVSARPGRVEPQPSTVEPTQQFCGAGRRIVICLESYWFFRNLEPVIRWLAGRGHRVSLLVIKDEGAQGRKAAHDLVAADAAITLIEGADRTDDWAEPLDVIRRATDLVHFMGPLFDGTPRIRGRGEGRAPAGLLALSRRPWFRRDGLRRVTLKILVALDRAAPSDPAIVSRLRALSPDLVVFSPLIDMASNQMEYLRAARAARIRSLFLVHSWDNLSSKSYLRVPPDHMAVWNEQQVQEASAFHDFPAERVTATGAQTYDDWFSRSPSCSREAFCRRVGLDPGQPIIVYTGSATLDSKRMPETVFVSAWLAAVRDSPLKRLAMANILIRPHPKRAYHWGRFRVDEGSNTVVWPRVAREPVSAESRRDYFDTLHFASVVVGLNTSAMIEAAIVGRPVLSLLVDEFRSSQDETYHYRYLVQGDGGIVRLSESLEDHLDQLAACLDQPPDDSAKRSRFLRSFVRPAGLERPAVEVLGELLERQGAMGPATAPRPGPGARGLRLCVPLVARLLSTRRTSRQGRPNLSRAWRRLLRGVKDRAPSRIKILRKCRHAAKAILGSLAASYRRVQRWVARESRRQAGLPRRLAKRLKGGIWRPAVRLLRQSHKGLRRFVRRPLRR